MHFELMTRLLSTERKFQTMLRRVGIIDALEKHFDTSSRVREEAIEAAHHDRDLKQAVQDGDVEAVKHIAGWAEIKFGKKEDEEMQG